MTGFNADMNNLFKNYQQLNSGNLSAKEKAALNKEQNALLKDKNIFNIDGLGGLDQNDVDMFVKGDVDGNGEVTQDELKFIAKYKSNFKSALIKEKADFELDGVKYFEGKIANGVIEGKYYKNGKLFSGTANGVKYADGEAANGIVGGCTYNDGVPVKELNTVTSEMVNAQKAFASAQSSLDSATNSLNNLKTDLQNLEQQKAEIEARLAENPESVMDKIQLSITNNKITTKENSIKACEKVIEALNEKLEKAQVKAEEKEEAYMNAQLSLVKQDKITKLYNPDGSLANGEFGGKIWENGVPFNGNIDNVMYQNGVPANSVVNGIMYQNGLPANGIVDMETYENGVCIKALSSFTSQVIFTQKILNAAQSDLENAENKLDTAKNEMESLLQQKAELEAYLDKFSSKNTYDYKTVSNSKTVQYKKKLDAINSKISLLELSVKSYEQEVEKCNAEVEKEQARFQEKKDAYIKAQLSLIEQGKMTQMYGYDENGNEI